MLRWLARLLFGRRDRTGTSGNARNAPPRADTASTQPRDRWGPSPWLLGGALWGGLWASVLGHTHPDPMLERDVDRQQPTPDPNDWHGVGPGTLADGGQPVEGGNEGGGGSFDGGGAGGGFDAGGMDGGGGDGGGSGE